MSFPKMQDVVSVAVEPVTNNVYVADYTNSAIFVFKSALPEHVSPTSGEAEQSIA